MKQIVALTSETHAVEVVFPGAIWEKAIPTEAGWSKQKLEQARQCFQSLPAASMVVIDRGRIIVEWGDSAKRIKVHSIRKSLLSGLYGRYVRHGIINLDATLVELGIDDEPPLTAQERQATLRTVIQARSGVYHPYVGGTPGMRETKPARGSHPPGTFWYYNNWDFNVLGTVFERQTNKKIAVAFCDEIAIPIGMQDFRLGDMCYERSDESVHPMFTFRLSARDMARFGFLFLRDGNWNGKQLIPKHWVAESTRSYSNVENFVGFRGEPPGESQVGYGYSWWVNQFNLFVDSFSAWGALGKFIIVIPERDIVVTFINHTELPDIAVAISDAEFMNLPNVSSAQMGELLTLLLSAQSR